ncbi:hypothetical protein [Microseira sp. BLCC-F43]|uniref:hypothetical protein n=1 Tax=Microseira sp. BLCC-F43 TaxID=3153602 RepID=UPI0035B85D07
MISFAVASKVTADPKTKLVEFDTEEPQDRYFSQYSNLAINSSSAARTALSLSDRTPVRMGSRKLGYAYRVSRHSPGDSG